MSWDHILCVWMAPFGRPVLPLVNSSVKTSSGSRRRMVRSPSFEEEASLINAECRRRMSGEMSVSKEHTVAAAVFEEGTVHGGGGDIIDSGPLVTMSRSAAKGGLAPSADTAASTQADCSSAFNFGAQPSSTIMTRACVMARICAKDSIIECGSMGTDVNPPKAYATSANTHSGQFFMKMAARMGRWSSGST